MRVLANSDMHFPGNWHRAGTNILYFQNNFKKDSIGESQFLYTLSFTYEFLQNETVFFAYCFPYSNSDLKLDIETLLKDPSKD